MYIKATYSSYQRPEMINWDSWDERHEAYSQSHFIDGETAKDILDNIESWLKDNYHVSACWIDGNDAMTYIIVSGIHNGVDKIRYLSENAIYSLNRFSETREKLIEVISAIAKDDV